MVFSPFSWNTIVYRKSASGKFSISKLSDKSKKHFKKSLKLLEKYKYEMLFFGKSSTIILAHQKFFFNTFWGIYHGIFPTLKP